MDENEEVEVEVEEEGDIADMDDEFIWYGQVWEGFKNTIGQLYPAIRDMNTLKRCWHGFCQGLQQEPRSTLFHVFVLGFGVLPFFGFIMFITGAFLMTFLTGFVAFCFMFFSGLMVFATFGFLILLCSVWLSWVMGSALTVWMEWPSLYGGVCTIRQKVEDKLLELGFIVKIKRRMIGNDNVDRNNRIRRSRYRRRRRDQDSDNDNSDDRYRSVLNKDRNDRYSETLKGRNRRLSCNDSDGNSSQHNHSNDRSGQHADTDDNEKDRNRCHDIGSGAGNDAVSHGLGGSQEGNASHDSCTVDDYHLDQPSVEVTSSSIGEKHDNDI